MAFIKKKHQKILIPLILIAVLIVAIQPNILQSIGLSAGISDSGGFSITSISNEFGNIAIGDFSGLNWIITTVWDGGSQSLVGTITPAQTKAIGDPAYESEFPLTIEVTALEERAVYSTTGASQPIYRYDLSTLQGAFYDTLVCPSSTFKEYEESAFLFWKAKYCVIRQQIGVWSGIDSPQIIFEGNIKMAAAGKTLQQTITNVDSSVEFRDAGNLLASAQWQGSLVTGSSPPNSALYVGVWKQDFSTWNLTLREKSDLYAAANLDAEHALNAIPINLTQLQLNFVLGAFVPVSIVNLCANNGRSCADLFNTIINHANAKSSELFTHQVSRFGDYSYSLNPISNSTTGKWNIGLQNRVQNPVVTFWVKADWIGVKTNVGRATITNVRCPEINSGETMVLITDISVQNSGSFFTVASCNGASQINNNQAGATTTASYISQLSYGQVSQGSFNCDVQLKNDVGNLLDSRTGVVCNISVPAECTSGDVRATGTTVFDCINGRWVERFRCAPGEELKFDIVRGYYCQASGQSSVCGNGVCEAGENATNCPGDCKPQECTLDSDCAAGEKCRNGECVKWGACSELFADGLFVLRYVERTTAVPQTLFGFIPLPWLAPTETIDCVPIWNLGFFALLIIAIIALIVALWVLKPRRRKRR